MEPSLNKAVSAAVLRLLRPLIRVLLRNGYSYGNFADLAKWVFVDVATKEFGVPGRKHSDSRISVVTGLTRKQVARVKAISTPTDSTEQSKYNRASRVIGGWLRDRRFIDKDGNPEPLPLDGTVSFTALVKAYSGDMTARSILDELQSVGAVERDHGGNVRLAVRGYVPKGSDAAKLHILGTDVALLIGTIDHNLHAVNERPRFQRKVAYDNLPAEALPRLRELTQKHSQAILEEIDRYLSQQDRDNNPSIQSNARKHAGIGIYYFEEDAPEEK